MSATPILTQIYSTAYGPLLLGTYNNKLCLCDWLQRPTRTRIDKRIQGQLASHYSAQACPLLDAVSEQLDDYFAHKTQTFDIPLLLIGTPFQQTVWQQLQKIPYGSTASYRQLAIAVNNQAASRAVANANNANAISIIIPCHRVIGSNGALTGYAGGLAAKQHLLELEQTAPA